MDPPFGTYDDTENITDTEELRDEIAYDALLLLLCVSFSQFFCFVGKTCYKNIKKYYTLNKNIKKIKDSDLENLINECSICLENYEINDKIIILNCTHIFHKRCLDLWLSNNNSCPICREDITV